MTSIGATVAACNHENQPNEAPTAPPNAMWGKRAVPPATGYIAPSSAWTSASSRIAIAPMNHEMIAAGPAVASAPCALNSHPEPMIDPPDAHSSPMNPISRRRPVLLVPPAANRPGTWLVSTALFMRPGSAYGGLAGIVRADHLQDEPPCHPIARRVVSWRSWSAARWSR